MAPNYSPASDRIEVPAFVKNFQSFCRWIDSETFPEFGKICFTRGLVWMDPLVSTFVVCRQTDATHGVDVVIATTEYGHILIPGWVNDAQSFQQWAASDDFPKGPTITFANGEVVVRIDESQIPLRSPRRHRNKR